MIDYGSIFVKFSSNQYIDDIQKGRLYFNTLQHFIDLEKSSGVAGQGDKNEAQFPVSQEKRKTKNIEIITNCTASYGFEDFGVFCISTLKPYDSCNGMGNYKFSDDQIQEFKLFGCDSCITITNIDAFICRFINACKKNNYEFAHAFVTYEEFYQPSEEFKNLATDNPFAICFRKDNRFELQQEYRFIICKHVDKPFILDVGDISDISKVCKNCFPQEK
ncbi:hypothetical protein [Lacrimispora sp. JR3]|uniref:hypothetical protein n=1 Tax=Lacrimispora sinapis TaxID=3111456 RepID=UPI003749C099